LALSGCSRGDARAATSSKTDAAHAVAKDGVDTRAPAAEDGRPLVSLAGEARPPPVNVIAPGAAGIYSRALRTWIYERPLRSSARLGYLRAGASSASSDKPVSYEDCAGGWFPVEPRGFVCADRAATRDRTDPIVRATETYRPEAGRKLPYIYGVVRKPGPIYSRLPTADELGKTEPGLDERMQAWLKADGEIGASYAQHIWMGGAQPPDPARAWQEKRSDPLPWFLQKGASVPNVRHEARYEDALVLDRMRLRVGYSFLHTFLFEGRRYGLTTDLVILPTDRMRPIQGSEFRGVLIGTEMEFPFAFVRHPKARYWEYRRASNDLVNAGPAAYRSAVKLTGKQQFFNGRLHYETLDGKWLSDLDASRLDPARRMPGWGKDGEKWIDVNITKQTLVLYEGTVPVYATLISTGEAGLEDHEASTATKRGIFRIHTKHLTATMSSDELGEEFELRDVPYVQYFDKEGYALHGAYWHDRFGMPKSHGCINLSPEDARRIFFWTEPALPPGWHGVLKPLTGTVMFVHP
jgi:hypothetical protein